MVAVDQWVEQHSNWGETLVVVTSDHETGYLWGPGSDPGWNPLANNGMGSLPGMAFYSTDNTNSLVPLCAKGGGGNALKGYTIGKDPVRGDYLTNVDIGLALFGAFAAE